MQNGKTFGSEAEATEFASKHKQAWKHKLFAGAGAERTLIGYHVVYLVNE